MKTNGWLSKQICVKQKTRNDIKDMKWDFVELSSQFTIKGVIMFILCDMFVVWWYFIQLKSYKTVDFINLHLKTKNFNNQCQDCTSLASGSFF